MMVLLIGVAIAVGLGAATLLWSYGALTALIGAALGASATVLVAALVFAYGRTQSGDERNGRTTP